MRRSVVSLRIPARLACGALAIAAPVCAALAAGEGLAGEELVVTATRMPLPEDEVLASTVLIGRDAIELSGASDPGDILRFHAGLDLGRNGGPGQTTAVFIRGANSNQTLVMVDGVRINPGTIGLAGLQNISPSMIERIEVVKGPRSSLYGTDASADFWRPAHGFDLAGPGRDGSPSPGSPLWICRGRPNLCCRRPRRGRRSAGAPGACRASSRRGRGTSRRR